MRAVPPKKLIDLLRQLGVDDRAKIRRAGRYAGRLARDLPLFESVWVDAMAFAGALTPFQAQWINAGRGDRLTVGPFVLERPLPSLGYADCFVARNRQDNARVQLAIASQWQADVGQLSTQLSQLADRHQGVDALGVLPIRHVGVEGQCLWAACPLVPGETVTQWMTSFGRFPVKMVERMAQRISTALACLHNNGIVHGDLRGSTLLLDARGDVHLPFAGLRSIVRPAEGFAFADLQREAYDGVAPEQIREAAPASVATDIYGCGAVWWHMLAGRPGVAGGNALAKLQGAIACELEDVRQWAFDAPDVLAELVADCVQSDSTKRPRSADELTASLHQSTATERRTRRTSMARISTHVGCVKQSPRRRLALWSGLAASVVLATAATWPLWRGAVKTPTASIRATAPGVTAPGVTVLGVTVPGVTTPVPGKPDETNKFTQSESTQSESPFGQAEHPSSSQIQLTQQLTQQPTQQLTPLPRERLFLPTDTPLRLERLDLKPSQIVCGRDGKRPQVIVPAVGLIVDQEGVVFRDVDFSWPEDDGQDIQSPTNIAAVMIRLEADRVSFQGCTFKSEKADTAIAHDLTAIRWTGASASATAEPAFITGRLRIADCVFRNVSLGIDCNGRGAIGIQMHNTLHLGPGPLIRLRRWPTQEDPTAITLSHVTLRTAQTLVEVQAETKADDIGRLTIDAVNCVFQPSSGGSLLLLVSSNNPAAMIRSISWTGEGALLSGSAAVAAWQQGKHSKVIDDATMRIAGLIRDNVQFAGPADSQNSASQLVRWQAPVRDSARPGISDF